MRLRPPLFVSWLSAVLIATAAALPVGAQGWTEEDAVAAALATIPVDALAGLESEVLTAELEHGVARPLPALALAHEGFVGDRASRGGESSVGVRQSFDLTGWRGTLRSALPLRQDAAAHALAATRIGLATDARTAFYRVRHIEERILALGDWIDALRVGVATATAREAAGDVSAYDRRRIERELEIAATTLASEEARLAESWAALLAIAPAEHRPTLVGELTPEPPAETSLRYIPELSRLDSLAQAADLERDAWSRPALRDWEIGAAYRLGNSPDAIVHGFALELSVPLPTRDTDRPRREALEWRAEQYRAEALVIETLATNGVRAAAARLRDTLAVLDDLGSDADSDDLTRMAELAYEAGETTLADLLDAYGSEAELRLARIDLQWEARRAAIDLERSRGLRRE